MTWPEWLFLGACILVCTYRQWGTRVPPTWWYLSRRKRAAMRLALRAARQLGEEVDWSGCCMRRSDREKCFCLIQYPHNWAIRGSPGYRVFAVWFATGRVDDLGDWGFHWGIFPYHTIDAYEECRAAGRPWPVGWVEGMRYWESHRPPAAGGAHNRRTASIVLFRPSIRGRANDRCRW